MPLPGPLVLMLRAHAETQARERKAAGDLWTESDYVFTKLLGGPLSPNTDYHDWKRLLEDAKVRDGRLHDARHTAATVLMLLGVPARVIDQIMGWEPGTSDSMRARYLHVPDAMLKDVARKIVEAIWGPPGNTRCGGCPQRAFQMFVWGFWGVRQCPELRCSWSGRGF